MDPGPPPGVVISAAAAELLARLRDRHGPVMFHQSGGCCDGSSPMCYPSGDFLVGDRDVLLGVLDLGDGVPGRGGGFSLEAPEGVRFLSRGRVFTDEEQAELAAEPVITGAAYERGERPSARGQVVALDNAAAPGTCSPRTR
jgi:uncharacterized protein